jgi:quercetin dioxygenase-like cupin family protein
MQRVIDNPRSGERIVISQSAAETQGELLAFDVYLQPGAHVPASHSHPRQEERFTVLAGCVRFRLGRSTLRVEPGPSLSVPPGTARWFGNCGPGVARVHVEVRPALRMQELLAESALRSTPSRPWWSRIINVALIPLEFQQELGVPHVPAPLLTALLTPLAWLRPRLSA